MGTIKPISTVLFLPATVDLGKLFFHLDILKETGNKVISK